MQIDRRFRVSGDGRWALATDGLQWVLQRRDRKRGNRSFTSMGFVRTTKIVLVRVMREVSVPEAVIEELVLDLPPSFDHWIAYGGLAAAGQPDTRQDNGEAVDSECA